jgi:excisionase family DNA binding protein
MTSFTNVLLTPKRVASICRVTPESIRKAIREGELPFIRKGKRYLVHYEDMVEYAHQKNYHLDDVRVLMIMENPSRSRPHVSESNQKATTHYHGPLVCNPIYVMGVHLAQKLAEFLWITNPETPIDSVYAESLGVYFYENISFMNTMMESKGMAVDDESHSFLTISFTNAINYFFNCLSEYNGKEQRGLTEEELFLYKAKATSAAFKEYYNYK